MGSSFSASFDVSSSASSSSSFRRRVADARFHSFHSARRTSVITMHAARAASSALARAASSVGARTRGDAARVRSSRDASTSARVARGRAHHSPLSLSSSRRASSSSSSSSSFVPRAARKKKDAPPPPPVASADDDWPDADKWNNSHPSYMQHQGTSMDGDDDDDDDAFCDSFEDESSSSAAAVARRSDVALD